MSTILVPPQIQSVSVLVITNNLSSTLQQFVRTSNNSSVTPAPVSLYWSPQVFLSHFGQRLTSTKCPTSVRTACASSSHMFPSWATASDCVFNLCSNRFQLTAVNLNTSAYALARLCTHCYLCLVSSSKSVHHASTTSFFLCFNTLS